MQSHMEKSTQIHLQYLLSNIHQIMKNNTDISDLVNKLSTRIQALESNVCSIVVCCSLRDLWDMKIVFVFRIPRLTLMMII